MKRIQYLIGALAITLIVCDQSLAQNSTWNWPDDTLKRKEAEEKNAYYTDMMSMDKYNKATPGLNWLLDNTPELNESIYINGIKIYKNLAQNAESNSKIEKYGDSLMYVYDKRMKYYGDTLYLLKRKAYDAFRVFYKYPDKYQMVYDIYQRLFSKGHRHDVGQYNIYPYMFLVSLMYENNQLTKEQYIEEYEKVSEVIAYMYKQKGEDASKVQEIESRVTEKLLNTVTLSCNYIEENMAPKLEENPNDTDLAKLIMEFSSKAMCSDRDFFREASIIAYKANPTADLAESIANAMKNAKKYDKAEEYYLKAIDSLKDTKSKANMYLELGTMKEDLGNKAGAREYYQKAADASENEALTSKAYTNIANLYMTSYKDCKRGESIPKDRAIFIAAYEMFKKAGNEQGMNAARQQFPSTEEIFNKNLEKGDQISVNCWVNRTVTIRTRD